MKFLYFLNLLASTFSVAWSGTNIKAPVNCDINEYLSKVEPQLIRDSKPVNDSYQYYIVRDGVEDTFLENIDTSRIGTYVHYLKVVYNYLDEYTIRDTQEIIIDIVDETSPTIRVPESFEVGYGEKLPDFLKGVVVRDNYDRPEDLKVEILNKEQLTTKILGEQTIKYQVTDKSGNVKKAWSRLIVVDEQAPIVKKKGACKTEINMKPNYREFYEITDNVDKTIKIIIDDHDVDYTKVGIYDFKLIAIDQSGKRTVINDRISVVHEKPIKFKFRTKEIVLEVHEVLWREKIRENLYGVDSSVFIDLDKIKITYDPIDENRKKCEFTIRYTYDEGNIFIFEEIKGLFIDGESPNIVRKRNDTILPVHKQFIMTDYFDITDNYDDASSLSYKCEGDLNIHVVGDYKVVLIVGDLSGHKTYYHTTVNVRDVEPPKIKLLKKNIELPVHQILEGKLYEVTDNYAKDIDIKEEIDENYFKKIGNYKLKITADDGANQAVETINVSVVDYEPPQINLKRNLIQIELGKKPDYKSLILDCIDNYHKVDKKSVRIIDNVNYNKIGNYEVIYTLEDDSNNVGYSKLTVLIDDVTAPKLEVKDLTINPTETLSLSNYIKATDNSGDCQYKLLNVPTNFKKPGTYKIGVYAYDKRGNSTYKIQNVTVKKPVGQENYFKFIIVILVLTSVGIGGYFYFKKKENKRVNKLYK